MMNMHPFLPGLQRVGRTRKNILRDVEEFGLGSLSDMVENKINLDILSENSMGKLRRRIYDKSTTFLLFLLQVMGSLACVSMVKYLQTARIAKGGDVVSSSTSAYCQARSRLELPTLRKIFDFRHASKCWNDS